MTDGRTRMFVELRAGESFSLDGGNVVVTLEQKSGQRSRLKIEAVPCVRVELQRKNGGAVPLAVRATTDVDAQERVA